MNEAEWLKEVERQAQRRHGARAVLRSFVGLTLTEKQVEDRAEQLFPSPVNPGWTGVRFQSGIALRMNVESVPYAIEWRSVTGGRWIPFCSLEDLRQAVKDFSDVASR